MQRLLDQRSMAKGLCDLRSRGSRRVVGRDDCLSRKVGRKRDLLFGGEPDLHSSRTSGQHVEIHGLSGGASGKKLHVSHACVILYAGLDNWIERGHTCRGFETRHALEKLSSCTVVRTGGPTRHTQNRTSDEYHFLCP